MDNRYKNFMDTFEEYLIEEYLPEEVSPLVEGPFDLFKKGKKLTPEQEAFANNLRAGLDKTAFVPADPQAGLDKTFFNTIGSAQLQQYRLWNNCYLAVCPMLSDDGATLTKASGAAAGSFSSAFSKAKNLAVEAFNSGKVKAYKKVFGDLPMPILFCVKPDDVVSSEFGAVLQKYANMPKMRDFGDAFGSSLSDAIVVGAYFMDAKDGQEFRMPVRVRGVFANGLGEFVNIKGVARDPKTGEAVN